VRVELSRFIEWDLLDIGDYIARHNPTRALSFVEELEREIHRIGDNPLVYQLRPDAGPDARAAVYGRYLILFRIVNEVVYVERVVSGYRDLAKLHESPG